MNTALSSLAALALTASIAMAQTDRIDSTRTTLDGVYTTEQARRGSAAMDRECADCHLENWFTGTFLASWVGARASVFYETLSTTMPEDRPGALKPQQYADIIAYIFELNGLPAGQRVLTDTSEVLEKIVIRQARKDRDQAEGTTTHARARRVGRSSAP